MAESESFLSGEQLQCSICLDTFTNPVSTPCGHNFCMTCIGRCWDSSRVCECPLCKEAFSQRPRLHINRILREITEHFKGTRGQTPVLSRLTRSQEGGLESDHEAHRLINKDSVGVSLNSDLYVDGIHRTVSQLAERSQEELQWLPERKETMMADYAVDVTFDCATAHPRLVISEDRKQVWRGYNTNAVPNNPERFDHVVCVLGREGFTGGRHYWEVGVAGKTDWDIGVASHATHRKGQLIVNPSHGYWFLSLRDESNSNVKTRSSDSVERHPIPLTIGVFLDYERGQVSFYNVDTKKHIHTFTDTFLKTVYPFFSPGGNKSGRNAAPLVISSVH